MELWETSGISNAPWTTNQTASALSWSLETILLRSKRERHSLRGTLYNFRFDSNRPPQAANATVGFFKTGTPITVAIQAPAADPLQSGATRERGVAEGARGRGSFGLPSSAHRGPGGSGMPERRRWW